MTGYSLFDFRENVKIGPAYFIVTNIFKKAKKVISLHIKKSIKKPHF
jgi:hypothetical protein